jgi:hypothetical protein
MRSYTLATTDAFLKRSTANRSPAMSHREAQEQEKQQGGDFASGSNGAPQIQDTSVAPNVCASHGKKGWMECWNCGGDGYGGHDCGDDTCCCLIPDPNIDCDICRGEGGWFRCYTCHPETEEENV